MSHPIWVAIVQAALHGLMLLQPCRSGRGSQTLMRRVVASPAIFCLAIAAMLLVGRWPWLFVPRELSPDESGFIAMAARFTGDAVPWRATHAATSGPLTPWLLAGLWRCGVPLHYLTTHAVALTLQILVICLAYGTLRIVAAETPARCATMPVALLLSRTGERDFIHLSSEHVPLVLLAGCTQAAALGLRAASERGAACWLAVAGMAAGSVLFAKPQAVPMAAVISTVVLVAILQLTRPIQHRTRLAMAFVVGGMAVPCLILWIVWWGGAWEEMVRLYIDTNLAYGNRSAANIPFSMRFLNLVRHSPLFTILGMATVVIAVAAFVRRAWHREHTMQAAWIACGILVATTAFCIAKPGYFFPHYLMLLTLPCILTIGVALCGPERQGARAMGWFVDPSVAAALAVSSAAALTGWTAGGPFLEGRLALEFLAEAAAQPPAAESTRAAALSAPHEEIAVWGWRSDIYVDAGRRPAVRDFAIVPDAVTARRFVEDLRANEPRLFIDAICPVGFPEIGWHVFGPTMVDRRLGGHENFPAFRDYVARHYEGREEVVYPRIGSVRIYERRR